jgi:amino acid transporter
MIGITALYILLQFVAQGILGGGLATATVSPLADAAGASLGGWARTLLLAGAAISMFGYLGGMTLAMPRVLYAFARDGFLPRVLARVDARHHVPRVAIGTQSALALALALTGTFEDLAILANIAALALYFGCAVAAWKLRGSAAYLTPWLACAVIIWLFTGVTRGEWLAFGGAIAVASLLYLLRRR